MDVTRSELIDLARKIASGEHPADFLVIKCPPGHGVLYLISQNVPTLDRLDLIHDLNLEELGGKYVSTMVNFDNINPANTEHMKRAVFVNYDPLYTVA